MKNLDASHVKVGQPLKWDVFDLKGQLLLKKAYVIESETQLRGLLERGMYVCEEEFARAARPQAEKREKSFNPFCSWDESFSRILSLLKNFAAEEQVAEKFGRISGNVIVSAQSAPDASIANILLKEDARYAYIHSLHVGVIASLMARKIGWEVDACMDAVCAALSMNVAMIDLQMRLLQHDTPLTPAQRQSISTHGQRGRTMLMERGVATERWLSAVELHHDKIALSGQQIADATPEAVAQLLRIADIFCAKISPRAYRRAMQPDLAAKEIFVAERENCGELANLLVKEVGLYMPGTFVKLKNGETSVVTERGTTVNTPKVVSLTRGDGMPFLDFVRRDTAHPEFSVRNVVPRETVLHAINPAKLWGFHEAAA